MIKALVGITALLIGLTGAQAPAQAYGCLGLNGNAYWSCQDQEHRMNEIQRQQREIEERQECIMSGRTYCH